MMTVVRTIFELPLGFNPENAVMVRFDLASSGYDEQHGRAFQRRLLEHVRSIPFVRSSSMANSVPFSIDQGLSGVFVEDAVRRTSAERVSAYAYQIEPDFFRTMGTRLLAGRDFSASDQANTRRVAIVNETFADVFLGQEPIGKRFRTHPGAELMEVVGVVEQGLYQNLLEQPQPAYWVPLSQRYAGGSARTGPGAAIL
jgi:putative ABC transport system permease protein